MSTNFLPERLGGASHFILFYRSIFDLSLISSVPNFVPHSPLARAEPMPNIRLFSESMDRLKTA
jgi:hypothetical protein